MATIYSRDKQIVNAIAPVDNMGGVTTIASGDSSVDITSTLATSGQVIKVGLGLTTVASHADLITSVSSISSGASFVLTVNNAVVDTQEVNWIILSK
jgi:hypothetical protein